MNTTTQNHTSRITLFSGQSPDIHLTLHRMKTSRRQVLGLKSCPSNANRKRTRSISKPELAAFISLGLIAIITTILAASKM